MNAFDAHAHAFPDAIAAKAVEALAAEGGITAHYDGTIAGLIAAMDRSGVDRALVAPVATKPSQVCGINDWISSLDEPRILPFGAMHPGFDEPGVEMARAASLGIRGIKLHSQHQGFRPSERRMWPIYEAAVECGLVVLFHAGGYVAAHENEATPTELATVLDAFPEMVCILAHMGGYLMWDEVRTHLCGRDVYLDTAYVPRNLDDAAFLSLARDHGIERVLFGTDGPWTDAGTEIAHLQGMGFRPDELEAMLHGNAERLFGPAD